jgi:SAM-dependent methyltransferase
MTVFDDVAEQFAHAIDRAIATNNYLRGRLVLDLIRSAAGTRTSILDYGCGPGRLAHLMAKDGFAVRAVDTSPAMIAQALRLDRTGLDLHFEAIAGEGDALPADSYDAIVCSSVIEYVVEPEELLRGFYRALRKQGVLVISFANKSSLWRRYWDRKAAANPMYTPNNRTWDWAGFKRLLEEQGFQPVSAPIFFESPCDWQRYGALVRKLALVGTIGIVAARPNRV